MTDDPRMERLERHLGRLKLVSTKARLDSILDEGARSELSFLDFLDKVIGEEVVNGLEIRSIPFRAVMLYPVWC